MKKRCLSAISGGDLTKWILYVILKVAVQISFSNEGCERTPVLFWFVIELILLVYVLQGYSEY